MNTTPHLDVQLADGFHFTDHLDAPYCLAFFYTVNDGFDASNLMDASYSHLYLSTMRKRFGLCVTTLDGSERREFFDQTGWPLTFNVRFSPDGTTLYWHDSNWQDSNLWKQDLATRTIQMLPAIPKPDEYQNENYLECSPDNSSLLLKQSLKASNPSGLTRQMDTRLYRVSTDGTDYRLLYRTKGNEGHFSVVCSWQHEFAIVYYSSPGYKTVGSTACMLYLKDGGTSSLEPLQEGVAHLTIRADGKEITWATPHNTIYSRTLEDGITRKLPISGRHPEWSPNGRQLVFLDDRVNLCRWNAQREWAEAIVSLASPPLHYHTEQRHFRNPMWSPDGNMLWFALSQVNIGDKPCTLSERLHKSALNLRLILHNLRLARYDYLPSYRPSYEVRRMGIVDLSTRQVMLSDDFYHCLAWLPRPDAKHA